MKRIREFSVYAELVPFDISYEELLKHKPKGIIFSGGPSSVYNSDAPIPEDKIFEMNLPLLGICYGHQLIVNKFGGKVKKRANKEYGSSLLTIDDDKDLLSNVESVRAWIVTEMKQKKFLLDSKLLDIQKAQKPLQLLHQKNQFMAFNSTQKLFIQNKEPKF